jgi:hypothetical protein
MTVTFRTIGRFFGYPKCCCAAFDEDFCAETKHAFPSYADNPAPWYGTGYIPCLNCAFEAQREGFTNFVATNITPHRMCAVPFPNGDYELEQYLNGLENQNDR